MTPPNIKPGELVCLKSGGPVMTVTAQRRDVSDEVWCQWFVGESVKTAGFKTISLRAFDETSQAEA